MSWESTADRVLQSTQRAFARREVIYTPASGAAVDLGGRAVFRAATLAVDTETGGEVLVAQPQLSIRVADLPLGVASPEDLVETAGKLYRVERVATDGEGGAILDLHEVAP